MESTPKSSGEALRNQIREQIFSSDLSKPKAKVIPFFGTSIEIRQPYVGQFLGAVTTDDNSGDNQIRLIKLLIENSYVPDTEERVFSMADYESLLALPFNNDMAGIVKAINDLTGVDIKAKEKN